MAERPIWRGQLRLALVSCPVALYAAHHERSNLHFNFINPKTGNRVRMVTLDAETDEELSRKDLAKGYEFKKDHYVLLDNEDFESARIDSSSVLTVAKFVPAESIDPVYFDQSYYVAPDGDAGQDVYAVLRDAIRQTGRVAVSRVVMARRERAVVIMPMERGLVLHTLHEARDISSPTALFDSVPAETPDPAMVQLATQLIDRQSEDFAPSDLEDRYEAKLRQVIEAKLAGEGLAPEPEPEADRGNVIDLMAALKKSLGQAADAPKAKAKPAASKARASARTAPQKPPQKPPQKAPQKVPKTAEKPPTKTLAKAKTARPAERKRA